MNSPVLVKHLVPADEAKSRWLNNMLAPAVEACNFENIPGIRILPLSGFGGRYRGQTQRFDLEWTVELSISAGFWRKEQILHTYIHECTHLLVFHEERTRGQFTHGHGPIFFLTNFVLAARVDSSGNPRKLVRLLDLYAFQDCPLDGWVEEAWRGAVIRFAFKNFQHLADSELSAEGVVRQAWILWEKEHAELLAREEAQAREAEEQAREAKEKERLLSECKFFKGRVAELERQRDVSFAWRFLFLTEWVGVAFAGIFGVEGVQNFV